MIFQPGTAMAELPMSIKASMRAGRATLFIQTKVRGKKCDRAR